MYCNQGLFFFPLPPDIILNTFIPNYQAFELYTNLNLLSPKQMWSVPVSCFWWASPFIHSPSSPRSSHTLCVRSVPCRKWKRLAPQGRCLAIHFQGPRKNSRLTHVHTDTHTPMYLLRGDSVFIHWNISLTSFGNNLTNLNPGLWIISRTFGYNVGVEREVPWDLFSTFIIEANGPLTQLLQAESIRWCTPSKGKDTGRVFSSGQGQNCFF